MRLDPASLALRDYHKAKRLLWDPRDLDLTQDRADWAALTPREQGLLRQAVRLFAGGETAVTQDLAPLLVALRPAGALEDTMFVTAQLCEESKHVEFFARFTEEVLEADSPDSPTPFPEKEGEVDSPPPSGERSHTPHYVALFTELTIALDALLADQSAAAVVRAVTSYHLAIEGVLAETGYYGFFTALRRRAILPGFTRGIELVQRDEARHIAFGLDLLSRHLAAEPALWTVVQIQLDRLLPLVQGVFTDLLLPHLPAIPFGLDLDELLTYLIGQFSARLQVLERARIVS
jgi:ribonucleoside-diphosphate reductase beta chain